MLLSSFFVMHFWHYSFSHPHSVHLPRQMWHDWIDIEISVDPMAIAANRQPQLSQTKILAKFLTLCAIESDSHEDFSNKNSDFITTAAT